MRLIKYFGFFTIGLTALVGVTLSLLVALSDSEPIKGYILVKIGDATDSTVTVKELSLQVFSSPHIQLRELKFIDDKTAQPVLELESGACNIELPVLLSGQVVINDCILNEPMITVRQQQDGSWQWLISPGEGEEGGEKEDGPSYIQFTGLKKLGIHNGTLTITHESRAKESRVITLTNVEATITAESDFKKMNVQMTATPSGHEGSSNITVEAQIHGDLLGTSHDSKTHAPTRAIQHMTTNLNLHDIDIRPLLMFVNPEVAISAPQLIGNLETTLTVFSDNTGYSFIAEDFSGRVEDFHILGKMSVTGISSDQPAFFLTGELLPYSIEQLTQLIPVAWMPVEIQSLFQQHTIRGEFDIPQFTIAGPLDLNETISILGTLNLTKGVIDSHSGFPALRNIQTSVTLEHQHLTINQFSADYESSRIQDATGRLELWAKVPSLALTVKGALQIKDILETAGHIDALKQDPPIWLKAEQVDGYARVGLQMTGALSGDGQLQVQRGAVVLEDVAFQLPLQKLPVRALKGKVQFDQERLRFEGISVKYGSSHLEQAHGRIEFRESSPWLAVTTKGHLHAQDVVTTVRQLSSKAEPAPAWLDINNVEGDAAMTLMIEGPLNAPGKLQIQHAELRMRDVGFQPLKYPFPIRTFSGHIEFDQEHAVIHQLKGKVGNSHTIFQGELLYGQHDGLNDVTIHSQVELSDLQTLFPGLSQRGGLSHGPIDVAMTVSGSTEQPEVKMNMDLTALNISYPSIFTKPAGISTGITVDGVYQADHVFTIDQSRIAIPPFHLDIQGSVAIDDSRQVNLTLTTGTEDGLRFPPDVIVGREQFGIRQVLGSISIQTIGDDWMAWTTNGDIDVNIHSPTALETSIGSDHTGRVQWTQEHNAATLNFRTQDFPLEALIPIDVSEMPKTTGNMTLDVSLKTTLTHAKSLPQAIVGEGQFQIENGQIVHSPTISRILSILNLPSVLMGKVNLSKEGIPFDSFSGTFTVANGLVTSENLLLNSPVLKMTAAGTYGLQADELDFMFAVSPFGQYSNLLKSIPMFGRLLKGERKGLTTALFEVKGPRMEPTVQYLPLQSLTEGVMGFSQFTKDVLNNIMTFQDDFMPEP